MDKATVFASPCMIKIIALLYIGHGVITGGATHIAREACESRNAVKENRSGEIEEKFQNSMDIKEEESMGLFVCNRATATTIRLQKKILTQGQQNKSCKKKVWSHK